MISRDSYPESALDSGSFSYALLYASMIGGYPKIGFESFVFVFESFLCNLFFHWAFRFVG